MKRLSLNLTLELATALKTRTEFTGVPQAEICRRALAEYLVRTDGMGVRKTVQHPVIFVPQQETW